MSKVLYFFKKIYTSFNNYLNQVNKGLQEIRNKGMGSKS